MPGAEDELLSSLREREKELNCLYRVDEILGDHQPPLPRVFAALVDVIPSGWRFPELCRASITYNNCRYQPPDFVASPLAERCPIISDGETVGGIEVVYLESVPETAEGVFLDKERKLIRTIADRIGQYVFCRDMKLVLDELNASGRESAVSGAAYGACDYRRTDGQEWRWRQHMAERLAASLDSQHFGVKSVYLFGSTKDGTAGRRSDIDLIIHFEGSEGQKAQLFHWLEGWSLCLDEVNYLKTGYRMNGLLDAHIVTDDDIARKTCFAVKIDLATDPAYRLRLKDERRFSG
jgi:hypothetical protein